ncbi:hypothetical protein [Thermoplasma acidophilum]|uniref:hypothetical protein n=1 Tax=Thermoplasma acidophilum TaxID=2303 RepID=UPI0012EAF0F1|nr:hypothetical protein [Thermoplasma acidophilum]
MREEELAVMEKKLNNEIERKKEIIKKLNSDLEELSAIENELLAELGEDHE